MARILIKGGSIVTMDPAIKDLPRGDILIENGKIAAVRPTIAADGAEVIDAAQMIVLPGLINAHDHLELNHYGSLPLGGPYTNASQWIDEMRPMLRNDDSIRSNSRFRLADRLFIGTVSQNSD